LDYHTDYLVKLTTETEHSSLYNWCLQEFDSEGEQVGRDLIPWNYSLDFEVSNIRYAYSLEHDDPDRYRFDEVAKEAETDEQNLEMKSSEMMLADLVPAEGRHYHPSYSMVGTNRKISQIHLRIQKAEKGGCDVWGSLSYTAEFDFRDETTDDIVEVHLRLTPDNFDELTRMINSNVASEASLRLSGVSGFYSDWSPEISTDFIKILTPDRDDHMVDALEGTEIDPPRLGKVQEFNFRLSNNRQLKSKRHGETNSVNFEWAKQQTEAAVRSASEDHNELDSDADDDDGATSYTFNEERAKRLRRTRKYELLNQMFSEASSYAENNNLGPDELDDLSYKINSFFSDLESAFQKDEWYDHENNPKALTDFYERTWKLWQNQGIKFDEIKRGEVPHIDRTSLTDGVVHYLALPIRNQSIERMLVDALVAMEVIAFADQMLNVPSFLKDLSTSPFVKSHPLWRFIKGQVLSLVIIAAIPIGVLVGAVNLLNIRGDWPIFVGLGFFGLWALFFLIGLIALPSFWISETRRKQKVGELLEAMHTVHTEIRTGTVVSARHIRERLDKSTDQGAVWPSEVFPLLDDIIDRGGVM